MKKAPADTSPFYQISWWEPEKKLSSVIQRKKTINIKNRDKVTVKLVEARLRGKLDSLRLYYLTWEGPTHKYGKWHKKWIDANTWT